MHQSVATIDSPEFINLQPLDLNPLMSKCEIKVLYIGQNRNRSFITKEVANEMAKTLRGAPIVGYYIENKEDFGDHGDQVIIDGEGIKFNTLTKPYGFVAPDSKIWFQKFDDTDEFGNTVTREYLMTEGYLWTGQYKEARRVIENGNPQSMELDEKSLKGYWSTDNNSGIDFFIINDAIFSKLCILGEDVEPCFEGANVTAPDLSTNFSKVADENFKNTLYNMMQELKFALKGGQMEETNVTEVVAEEPVSEVEQTENFSENQEEVVQVEESLEVNTSFEASKKDDEEEDKKEESSDESDDKDDEKKPDNKSALVDEKYEALQSDYNQLNDKYTKLENDYNELQTNYQALVDYKNEIENKEKDELINSFTMLTDEDKAEVVEHKTEYSLDEIEAKLAVIGYRKGVNFTVNEEPESNFTLAIDNINNAIPDWVKAVEDVDNN